MKDVCELCSLCSPQMGCTKLENESCLKEALKNIKPSVTNGEVMQTLFPNTELHWTNEYEYGLRPLDSSWIIWFKGDWWNRKWGE